MAKLDQVLPASWRERLQVIVIDVMPIPDLTLRNILITPIRNHDDTLNIAALIFFVKIRVP